MQTGDERFEEAILYIEKHRLYTASLDVWKEYQEKSAVGVYIHEPLMLRELLTGSV